MKFQARLALVNAKAPTKADAPNVVSLKLEPLYIDDPGWLFDMVGEMLVVDVSPGEAVPTPLEEAINAASGR